VHQKLGWFGAVLGAAIPIVGVSIAITMGRFNAQQLHQPNTDADLIIPLWDMLAFTPAFALAIYWRKRPEFHRRLMLIATCALTAAAFGRFPEHLVPSAFFYAGVDLLIVLGAARDFIVNKTIHVVYRYALPGLILGQTFVMYTNTHHYAWWLRIAHSLLA